MGFYVFRFFDSAGDICFRHSIRLLTAASAIRLGQQMFEARPSAAALEIWQLGRIIHVVEHHSARPQLVHEFQ